MTTATARAADTYSRRQQRLIATQVHVSAALILAAALFWAAGEQLDDLGRWLRVIMILAAGVTLIGAVLPWLLPGLSPRTQRACIWVPLILAVVPSAATITFIGFEAAGACQLLVIAGIFAEIGARRRMLVFLWAVLAVTFTVTLWHLYTPWL